MTMAMIMIADEQHCSKRTTHLHAGAEW